jgi:uncharacterized protein (TIGR03435 family)
MRLKFISGTLFCASFVSLAQSQQLPSFETAAINPVSHPSPNENYSDVKLADARRFRAVNADLSELIEWAYEVRADRISGPADLHSKIFTFDIDASLPEQVDKGQARLMLRRLLGERFGVVLHSVSKPTTGYLLMVDSDRPKLRRAELPSPKAIVAYGGSSSIRLISPAANMGSLASSISRSIEVPVVDQTHLDGLYDINITFSRIGPVDGDAPTVFEALKQFGLHLDKAQIPIETIVVEHANFKPTAN